MWCYGKVYAMKAKRSAYAKELVTPYIKNIFNKIHIGHSKNI